MSKSARVSVRLEKGVEQAVEALAREERRAKSAVLRELLQEAIRMRRCPGILFLDGPTGRRPVIAGSGLEVWEVVAAYQQECQQDFERLRTVYDWLTPTQLRNALTYYRLYTGEIDEEIQRQQALTEGQAQQHYPHLFPPTRADRSR